MSKNVLLVAEDNAVDALLLERALRRSGTDFEMVRVADGVELIDYLEARGVYKDRVKHPAPHVILLDLKMPRKDGFAVLRWRRDTPVGYQLPVVVFSSSALPQDIEKAYSLGASSYVVKPSAPERLEGMVKALHEWWGCFNTTPSVTPA